MLGYLSIVLFKKFLNIETNMKCSSCVLCLFSIEIVQRTCESLGRVGLFYMVSVFLIVSTHSIYTFFYIILFFYKWSRIYREHREHL
nr:MAG TPA: hypothetical protein [Caudoviricetes sp.]